MNKEVFKSFYNGNIKVIAEAIVQSNSGFAYVENVSGIYEEYLNQKTMLKNLIKSNDDMDSSDYSLLLDGHKVAACITCAIIKVRLLVNQNLDDDDEFRYELKTSSRLNEQLALLCGLSCLIEYMADNSENLLVDPTVSDKMSLIFPKTNYPERSSYLDSLVRGLYYSNLLSNINPLLLAHIFFMVEQYHRQGVKLQKLQTLKI